MRRPRYKLATSGPLRTVLPISLTPGDEVEVTTEADGHGGFISRLRRRWNESSDGVVIVQEETDPVVIREEAAHPEIGKLEAHIMALDCLAVDAGGRPDLRQLVSRGFQGVASDEPGQ